MALYLSNVGVTMLSLSGVVFEGLDISVLYACSGNGQLRISCVPAKTHRRSSVAIDKTLSMHGFLKSWQELAK